MSGGASLTPTELFGVVIALVLLAVVVALFLYFGRRLRARHDELLGELRSKPELVRDRAFNRIAMSRREAEILAGSGVDVDTPREQIAQAQAAFDLRRFSTAYDLAQSAHEGLVRRRGGRSMGGDGGRAPASLPLGSSEVLSTGPAGGEPPAASPSASLPKGRAEAHFMIGALGREMAAAPPTAGATIGARGFYEEAQRRFSAGDYPSAFQLALRGRRAIGAPIESLGAAPSIPRPAGRSDPGDAERAATSLADAARCTECGYPIPAGDAFCRGCGRPLVAPTCPACGAPRLGSERFCGRCGATFPA